MNHKLNYVFAAVASGGVILTTILAVKETPKAIRLLEERKKEEELSKLEKIKTVAPAYIPAIASGLATVAFIFASVTMHNKSSAPLIGACAYLDQAYQKCKNLVKEQKAEKATYSPDKHKSFAEALFFDNRSDRYFWRTMEEMIDAEYHLNRNFILQGYVTLNDFYLFLGLEPITGGDEIGWDIYSGLTECGYKWIDFEHWLVDESDDPDTPSYYNIVFPFPPHGLNLELE